MTHDPRRVLEIVLDELAQVLGLTPDQVAWCRRQLAEWLRPRRPVLFLATGDAPLGDETVESFRALTALGIDATLVRSHSFAQVWTTQELRARLGAVSLRDSLPDDELRGLPQCYPLLCVLALSGNTVAKTILGLQDALPSRVLRAFLERGRPVMAVGLPPPRLAYDESGATFWGLPLAVRQWLSEGYRTLEQWGVEFVEAGRLAEAMRRRLFGAASQGVAAPPPETSLAARSPLAPIPVRPEARVFITVDDVRAARARGDRRLQVPPHASLTDEAREFARRWGILLLE